MDHSGVNFQPSARRRRCLESPLAPSVIDARNREVKERLSSSSLVLGGDGAETRDWSLSSMQHAPKMSETWDPKQREKMITIKEGESLIKGLHFL